MRWRERKREREKREDDEDDGGEEVRREEEEEEEEEEEKEEKKRPEVPLLESPKPGWSPARSYPQAPIPSIFSILSLISFYSRTILILSQSPLLYNFLISSIDIQIDEQHACSMHIKIRAKPVPNRPTPRNERMDQISRLMDLIHGSYSWNTLPRFPAAKRSTRRNEANASSMDPQANDGYSLNSVFATFAAVSHLPHSSGVNTIFA
ncbi:hypothetical protein BDW42DRAFT_67820 [Aspergillus taichungensis]|uniref:Uncharacterized protein n=1 Tax=Aspergillus taichungensis TaxID=482145 RepID=A0A2J5I0M7_9EURO|nr:hypothetical protein BDW42DRAFT_67820 [Aspergillus taichungensis]